MVLLLWSYNNWSFLFSLPKLFFSAYFVFVFLLGFFMREFLASMKRWVEIIGEESVKEG